MTGNSSELGDAPAEPKRASCFLGEEAAPFQRRFRVNFWVRMIRLLLRLILTESHRETGHQCPCLWEAP